MLAYEVPNSSAAVTCDRLHWSMSPTDRRVRVKGWQFLV